MMKRIIETSLADEEAGFEKSLRPQTLKDNV